MIAVAPPPSPLVQPTKRKHGGRVPPIVTAADALTRLDALDPHGMMSGEEEKFESPSATLSIAPRRELGARPCSSPKRLATVAKAETPFDKLMQLSRDGGLDRVELAYHVRPDMDMHFESLSNVTFFAHGTNCGIFTAMVGAQEGWCDAGVGVAHSTRSSRASPYSVDAIQVIVKMIAPSCTTSELACEEIEREIELLARLEHHGIVRLFGAGHKPRRFMVLERLDGGTLGDVTRALGGGQRPTHRGVMAMPYRTLLVHAHTLAAALEFIHHGADARRMTLHRDLKPDNIGFTGGVLKLLDFGLACSVERAHTCNQRYEMTGETGTLRYMAPEVARSEPYNEKIDTFSFGLCVWEMASGRQPFVGFNAELFRKLVVDQGVRPELPSMWPRDFCALLEGCWCAEPADRLELTTVLERLRIMMIEMGAEHDDLPLQQQACATTACTCAIM